MTVRRVSTVLVGMGAALVCLSAAFAAERTPQEWLERMNHAFIDTDYDGIFSYYSGNDLSTLRVVHSIRDGVQHERLIHLNGAPREIIRTGNQVEFVLQPGDEILELENSIPSGPFAQAFTTATSGGNCYTMALHGHDRVADRDATRLDVLPRDHDRYGFHLWLDDDTGLLLRSELVDSAGQKLEIFQFATLKIGDIKDSDLKPDHEDGALISHLTLDAARQATASPAEWRAGWVPNGFTMDYESQKKATYAKRFHDGVVRHSPPAEFVAGGQYIDVHRRPDHVLGVRRGDAGDGCGQRRNAQWCYSGRQPRRDGRTRSRPPSSYRRRRDSDCNCAADRTIGRLSWPMMRYGGTIAPSRGRIAVGDSIR